MSSFANYQPNEWNLFVGNALLLATAVLYLLWWVLAFWPKYQVKGIYTSSIIIVAIVVGFLAIFEIALGASTFSRYPRCAPVWAILLAAAVFYVAAWFITFRFFKREVTAELLVMTAWAALEFLLINVLYGTGRFSLTVSLLAIGAVSLAMVVGLVCYVLYYRLSPYPSFWDGLIPLAVDSIVLIAVLFLQALSRALPV
jgi:hypothetical protein